MNPFKVRTAYAFILYSSNIQANTSVQSTLDIDFPFHWNGESRVIERERTTRYAHGLRWCGSFWYIHMYFIRWQIVCEWFIRFYSICVARKSLRNRLSTSSLSWCKHDRYGYFLTMKESEWVFGYRSIWLKCLSLYSSLEIIILEIIINARH